MNAPARPLPLDTRQTDDLVGAVERLESVIAGWEGSQRSVAFAYRNAIDALHKAAISKLIADVKAAPGALEALRAATGDPLVYTVLRYHGLVRPSLQERVESALATVRPMLASHGGNVELVAVSPPDTVEVRFLGNCDHCPSSTLTFIAGVRRAIEEHCPEIKEVRQVRGTNAPREAGTFVSPFAAGAFVSPLAAGTFVSPFAAGVWRFATMLDSIPAQGFLALVVDSDPIVLARNGRGVTCFRDACAHLGLTISGGRLTEGRITCPHHGFVYDLATGECLTAPEVQLSPVAVRLVDDRVEIRRED
jgi:Fe-S cluster biogenesis protein NfuA/nitrite reductase/ring-hydroxylating ferredoxin subunit